MYVLGINGLMNDSTDGLKVELRSNLSQLAINISKYFILSLFLLLQTVNETKLFCSYSIAKGYLFKKCICTRCSLSHSNHRPILDCTMSCYKNEYFSSKDFALILEQW